MITSKIDKLGRVVIPASYRQALGIRVNDTLTFSMEGQKVVVRATQSVCKLCGADVTAQSEVPLRKICIKKVKAL